MTRKATWTNADGLIVGFGPNTPEVVGAVAKEYGGNVKNASVVFDYTRTGVNVPVPAGAQILSVQIRVGTAWVGGTTLEVGDGSDADGFVTAAQGATANLLAGAVINASGLYTAGGTDTTAREFKAYASADTIDVSYTGTYTAGTATLVVSYM